MIGPCCLTTAHILVTCLCAGCHSTEAGEPVAAAIDGGDWHLPLSPLSSTSMPEPYSLGEQPERDRLQAAARMVSVCMEPSRGMAYRCFCFMIVDAIYGLMWNRQGCTPHMTNAEHGSGV